MHAIPLLWATRFPPYPTLPTPQEGTPMPPLKGLRRGFEVKSPEVKSDTGSTAQPQGTVSPSHGTRLTCKSRRWCAEVKKERCLPCMHRLHAE